MGNNCSDTSPAGPGPGSGTSTTETKSYDPIILERKDLDEKLANKMTWSQSGSVMTIVAVGKLKLLSNKAKARVNSQKEEQDKKTENNRNLTIKQSKFHNEVPVYNNGHHAYHNRQNTTSTELLKQRLDFLGLESVESVGDGNCQFRSISNELYATQNHHLHIRKIAVFWLKEHSEEYYCYVGDNNEWKKYLYNMSQPRTWGDELTLRAVCDALSITIHLISMDTENWHLQYNPSMTENSTKTSNSSSDRHVFLSYISPIHYNTVRLRQ